MYIMSMKKELDMNIDAKSFYIPMTLLVFGYAFAVFACPDMIALLSFVPFYLYMTVAFLKVKDECKETGLFFTAGANVAVSVILSLLLVPQALNFVPLVRWIVIVSTCGLANLLISIFFIVFEAVCKNDLSKISPSECIIFFSE